MWTILRYKKNELNTLLKNLKTKLPNDVNFYQPKSKISILKNNRLINKTKPLLNDYIFCYSPNFRRPGGLNIILNTKGLKSLIGDCFGSQDQIIKFIACCKKNEDNEGNVKQNMIQEIVKNKLYKFTSGPFANLIFELLEKNKKELKILVGKVTTKVDINTNYNFQLV